MTDKRAQYLRLVQQGTSNAEACRIVGVNRKTGTRWKHGRKYTNRADETWVYPPVASPEKLAEPPSGRFLSEFERIRIADLLRVRTSFREIGRQLGRLVCPGFRAVSLLDRGRGCRRDGARTRSG